MRVIIITSSSNRSGGTRQAVYQAQGLSERGHDVALCLPHDSTLWDLPNATSNPLWNMLPEDPAQHRTYVEPFAFNEGLPSQFGSLCPGNQLVLPQAQNPRHPKRHSR